jgi:hypothetical protein
LTANRLPESYKWYCESGSTINATSTAYSDEPCNRHYDNALFLRDPCIPANLRQFCSEPLATAGCHGARSVGSGVFQCYTSSLQSHLLGNSPKSSFARVGVYTTLPPNFGIAQGFVSQSTDAYVNKSHSEYRHFGSCGLNHNGFGGITLRLKSPTILRFITIPLRGSI